MATESRESLEVVPGTRAPSMTRFLLPGILAMVVAFLLAVLVSGIAAPRLLADPGALVRWSLPISRTIHHSAMAMTIAALIFASCIIPRTTKSRRPTPDNQKTDAGSAHPVFLRAMNIAAGAGVVWTLSAACVMLLTFWDLAGLQISFASNYTTAILDYILEITTGRAWAWMVVIAAIVTSLALAIRSQVGVGLSAAFSLLGIVPLAFIGHAAGGDDHYAAVNSIALHLLAVVLWFGGIMVLGLLAPTLAGRAPGRYQDRPLLLGVVLRRYSTMAAVAIALMAGSGLVSALIRITAWEQWLTPYGTLVLAKVVLTLALGALGLAHRNWVIPKLLTGTVGALSAAWRVVMVEVALMAATIAVATVLARTAPPTPDTPPVEPTPARLLTGYELPEPLVGSSWFTVWRIDWLWAAIILFLMVFYVWAFVTLRRRGDKASVLRMISWFVGLLALFYVTSGAPAVYGKIQFSVHMIDHMSLTMIVPIFLVLGTPVTLALQVLPSRTDGTRGAREWILWLVHSPYSKLITHPIFAAINFAGSIVIFYFTPVLEPAMRYHAGHELMIAHFLLTGYLFVLSHIDADPIPFRFNYPFRLLILLATVAFHAFFGVALMGMETLLAGDWFGNMGRDWGPSALDDQVVGAGIMWAIGEVPTLVIAIAVMVSWSRSDEREKRRVDRQADRDGGAELAAYNEMFAQLKKQDQRGQHGR